MRYLYNIIVLLLLIAGVALVVFNFAHFGNVEWTDNAHVCQHVTPQNTRVQGFIREIRFEGVSEGEEGRHARRDRRRRVQTASGTG